MLRFSSFPGSRYLDRSECLHWKALRWPVLAVSTVLGTGAKAFKECDSSGVYASADLGQHLGAMSLDIRLRFGRAIRRVREAQKINQEEAAERCGLHRTYYSGVERGVRNVSLVNIEKIAKGLKRSLPDPIPPRLMCARTACEENHSGFGEGLKLNRHPSFPR